MSSLIRSGVQLPVYSARHVICTQHDTSFTHTRRTLTNTFCTSPNPTSLPYLLSLPFSSTCPSLRENGRVYWLIISAFSFTFQIFFFQSLQIGPLPPATLISALLLATPMDEIFSHDSSDPTHTHIQGLPPAPPSLPGLYSPPNR